MPNGRSGGFVLKPCDFERLLKQCEGETVVGKTEETVTASELLKVLEKWKGEKVIVEEHFHSQYVVQFPEWVTVTEESPLFQAFRRAHTEFMVKWAKEHQKGDGAVNEKKVTAMWRVLKSKLGFGKGAR